LTGYFVRWHYVWWALLEYFDDYNDQVKCGTNCIIIKFRVESYILVKSQLTSLCHQSTAEIFNLSFHLFHCGLFIYVFIICWIYISQRFPSFSQTSKHYKNAKDQKCRKKQLKNSSFCVKKYTIGFILQIVFVVLFGTFGLTLAHRHCWER
jgi:hypothetical protein